MRHYFELVRSYRYDPLFPTPWLLASNMAAQQLLTERLNNSLLLGDPTPRKLKLWERVLLGLGF